MFVCSEPGCPVLTTGSRCEPHRIALVRRQEAGRPSRQRRGYDAEHDRARAGLAARLPAECGYCGKLIRRGDRWVAAHIVDGAPEHGWMVACPDCNERAKIRRT